MKNTPLNVSPIHASPLNASPMNASPMNTYLFKSDKEEIKTKEIKETLIVVFPQQINFL